jgi:hypothetical protein
MLSFNVFNGTTSIKFIPSQNQPDPDSTSISSFLDNRNNISHTLVNDYQKEIANRYYNSPFDDGSIVGENFLNTLCQTADSFAKGIYKIAYAGNLIDSPSVIPPKSIATNCTLLHEIWDCVTKNISCSLSSRLSLGKSYF